MSAAALSLTMLGAGVATWPSPSVGQLRLQWVAQNRWARADGVDRSVASVTTPGIAARHKRTVGAFALCLVTLGLVGGGAATVGPVPAVLAAGVIGTACRVGLVLRSERARRADRADLAIAVSALIDECAAGASLADGLRSSASAAGAHRVAFESAATAAAGGADVAGVWQDEPGLTSLALACSLAADSGAGLGPALSAVRDELRADTATGAAAAEILAGPVSSAFLLALLPVLGIGLGIMMGASPMQMLLHTRWGEIALALGVILDLVGILWTVSLARRATP